MPVANEQEAFIALVKDMQMGVFASQSASQSDDSGVADEHRGLFTSPVPPVDVRLFGAFELRLHGKPVTVATQAVRSVLALLLLHNRRPWERATLASILWPDTSSDRALFYLRRALTDLRHVLDTEAHRLISFATAPTLRFDLSQCRCDVTEFDQLLAVKTEDALQHAIALYRAPLLEAWNLPYINTERELRATRFLDTLEQLAEGRRANGDIGEASRLLRIALQQDPLRESIVRSLMETLGRSGDFAGVERVYQQFRRTLRDELNIAPSVETRTLYERLQSALLPGSQPDGFAPLPRPMTSLIGRIVERDGILSILCESRLVTLTGPGGAGKTRLALFVAESIAAAPAEFADGVCFADLSADTDVARIIQTVTASLGLRTASGCSPSLEALAGFLQTRRMLLVVDNAEHVAEACTALLDNLLGRCPDLHVLCTSRQPLSLAGERVFPVAPLAVPDASGDVSLESLAACDSVRLLLDRVRLAAPAFRMDTAAAPAIASLCRALDGLPLALELIAPRFRSLAPEEIVSRLVRQVHSLTGGGPGHPRHRTLQATLDWSYDLLSAPEQTLIRALTVFRGGWTLDAAEAVYPGPAEEAAALLTALVDKSLVLYDASDGSADSSGRYHFLETTRQYADERLNEPERSKARRRHAAFFARLATEADARANPKYYAVETPTLRRDRDNFHTALATLRDIDEPDEALRLEFFIHAATNLLPENYRDWIDRLSREPAPPGVLGLRMTYCVGLWALWNRHPATETLLQSLLTAAAACRDTAYQVVALDLLSNLADENDDVARSWHYMERAVAILPGDLRQNYVSRVLAKAWVCLGRTGALEEAMSRLESQIRAERQNGDEANLCDILFKTSELLYEFGDYARAQPYWDEAIPLAEVWLPEVLPYLWHRQAWAAQSRQDYAQAGIYLGNALDASRKNGRLDRQGWIHTAMAGLAFEQSDALNAERHLCESLRLFLSNHEQGSVARCLVRLAEYCIAWGRFPRAATLLGSVERILDDYSFHDTASQRDRIDLLSAQIRDAIGEEDTDRHIAGGRGMTVVEAVTFARKGG